MLLRFPSCTPPYLKASTQVSRLTFWGHAEDMSVGEGSDIKVYQEIGGRRSDKRGKETYLLTIPWDQIYYIAASLASLK